MSENHLKLAATFAAQGLEDEPDLEARMRRAMRQAIDVWFDMDESLRIKAAVAAALAKTINSVEKDRITRSWNLATALAAGVGGIPVDFEEARKRAGDDALPLLGWWAEESKAEAGRKKEF